MNNKELKAAVKKSLQMKREPRNLNIFYLFWTSYHYTKPNEMPFVATSVLQRRFKISSAKYKKYFDGWVGKFCGRPVKGLQCRYIETWTPQFIQLMNETKSISIPRTFFKELCYQTKSINKQLLSIINNNNTPFSSPFTDYYHNTKDSPFRWYHAAQGLTKQQKRQLFGGCYDIDIESCFSSIAYHDLKIHDDRLRPENKKYLRAAIMRDFRCDEPKSKQWVSILFSQPYKHSWGVKWFDQLHKLVTAHVDAWIQNNSSWAPDGGWSYHKVFTFMEQRIMNKIITEDNLVLRMHDGCIMKEIPHNLHQAVMPHKVSVMRM